MSIGSRTIVGQLDVLETMTPKQFASFRPELGTKAGFQSDQFRVIEATLGRRDFPEPIDDPALAAALRRRSVFDSFLCRVCEALIDIDEGLQEWRYRPAFPDLWEVRSG